MYFHDLKIERTICVKVESGEDLLGSLQSAVEGNAITNGVIVNGIGSISSYHVHVIETVQIPPGNTFIRQDGPYDLNSVQGFIIEGKVHAHILFSNDRHTFGGHLEEGTTAHTFCVVTICDTSESSLKDLDYFKGKRIPAADSASGVRQ